MPLAPTHRNPDSEPGPLAPVPLSLQRVGRSILTVCFSIHPPILNSTN